MNETTFHYDVVVVGAGHAGCEAALASAKMGCKTLLITMDMNKIAQMSCNPAIGGIAKGQIVREVDALGGAMGKVTDMSSIQMRMLNRSKGPAMWSPRAQCDRMKYSANMRHILENCPGLDIWQDQVDRIITSDNGKIEGIHTIWNVFVYAQQVVITAGTFLNGLMHIGNNMIEGGRIAEPAAKGLSESIMEHGVRMERMKTGTPVRIDKRSVHIDEMEEQFGEDDFHSFSFSSHGNKNLKQLPCWTCSTNSEVHKILNEALPYSPLYNGQIHSTGPRYCPSIETKLVTFPTKDQHPLFLEPEGEDTNELYLNGFSSSLPISTQLEALKQIPCFRDIKVYRPGYAIEYDYFDPKQLEHSLESKIIEGLFLAGQVNGTTGYEEAAGQGLVAGINAALKHQGKEPFVLGRNEAYIGVLIDDLTTKGVDEPYRMFTSRAEYRILLRQDNADQRLTEKGYKLGIVDETQYTDFKKKMEKVEEITSFCEKFSIKPNLINDALTTLGTSPLKEGCKLFDLIMRPQISLKNISDFIEPLKRILDVDFDRKDEIIETSEIIIKYSGYIEREKQLVEKAQRLENIKIKNHFDYSSITQLSTEARQKLSSINPDTLAQASRIPGISPSDINVLLVLLRR